MICHQVLLALEYIHSLKLIHCDLKPVCMVDDDVGIVIVVDVVVIVVVDDDVVVCC